MKAIPLLAVVLVLAALPVRAQVTVEMRLEQTQFLRNETLPVQVRITNRSGLPLKIGETPDWLTFTVLDRDGKVVSPVQTIAVGGKFELDSAASITKSIDLSPAYDFNLPGKYRVSALAQFPQLKIAANSDPQTFEIVRGAQLWQDVCGVPSTNGTPQYIRYSVLQAFYFQQLRLYVRVSDEAEEQFARVVPLGPVVSFAKPEEIIDRTSILHVLFQSGPRTFEYRQVSPRGELVQGGTYDMITVNPRLKIREDGRVEVTGGRLRGAPGIAARAPAGTNATNVISRPAN